MIGQIVFNSGGLGANQNVSGNLGMKLAIAFGLSVRPSVQNLLRYSFEISYMDSSSKNN